MKIEDKIYVPHVCPECNTARLILRDDLHDNPTIICTECGKTMKRWVIHKEAPFEPFSRQSNHYLTYTQKLRQTTGSPWDHNSGSSLADVRKKVGQDLVDYPGMPEMVFLPSEYEAAQLRAKLMKEKIEDLVVTLVYKVTHKGVNHSPVGTIYVESLRYNQVVGRVHELRDSIAGNGTVKVLIVYSEKTGQVFGWNDLELETKPRLPRYGQKYDGKRQTFRRADSGVM